MPEYTQSSELNEEGLRELMIRYQQADANAANQLVAALSPALLRFFAANPYTRDHAEDLLQECWMRIHRARHTYRPSEPLLPWVFAIARHTKVDALRRSHRTNSREVELSDFHQATIGVEAKPHYADYDLQRLLAELPESQREVIIMLKVSGMSLEEVARATSTTVGAVKQKAHRAYRKLRRILEERMNSQGTNT